MVKYKDAFVVFEEIPDKVSLAINITNCQNRCKGCHSPELRCDIGRELTNKEIDNLIKDNDGINCIIFMGEGNDINGIVKLAEHIKNTYHEMALAIYSGRESVEQKIWENFDYVKIGSYMEEFGPLNKETTNQKLYEVRHKDMGYETTDITYKFWKRA